MRIFTILVLSFCFLTAGKAQVKARNTNPAILINASYAYQLPAGDLVDRFGQNWNTGGGVEFINRKNWIIGTQINYLFGNEVKDVLFDKVETETGIIYSPGLVAGPSDFQVKQRGLYVGGHIGKLIGLFGDNTRSGLRITVGAGYLEHRIRVQDDPSAPVPIILGEYKEGWDRLTSGFALTQFIGYQFMAKNRLLNFSAGLEFTQGFTKNARDYDFATLGESDQSSRRDNLLGFRINWTLPLYLEGEAEEIFY